MSLLDFANPMGWWWSALALPIIALYILKVRLRRQRVSTFMFWDRLFDEKKPRAWWQQLRHWMSLLLQLALLSLLVGALVDPLWHWQKNQRSKLVLVVDNSASMAAVTSTGGKRIDEAKRAALAFIRSLRAGDEMAILTAGGKPAVAIGMTDHSRSLLEALDRIALTDAPTALTDTIASARRLLPADQPSRIVVLTDGCDPATSELSQDESLSLYGVGDKVDNLAITQFQARRSLLDAIGYQVLIEVTNFGDLPKRCQLDLTLEGQLVDVVPLELEPGKSKTLNLDQASSSGGRLVARLDAADALPIDNSALAVLPVRRKMPVTLVTPGSVFLRSVLESIPLVELTVEQFSESLLAASKDRVLVLHQQVPERLPSGKVFVINPRTNCDLWSVGDRLEHPIVSSVSAGSPITQHVQLVNVVFLEALQLDFNVDVDTLISTPLDEPLLAHIRRPSGDILVLNLNLDQGDLPLRIAFPVFMKNAIEWFQGVHAELQPSVSTGNSATVELHGTMLATAALQPSITPADIDPPADEVGSLSVVSSTESAGETSDLWVRDPSGNLTPLAHSQQRATIALLTHCGLWTIGSKVDLVRDPWAPNAQTGQVDPPAMYTGIDASTARSVDTTQDSALDDRLTRVASNLCNREESDLRPRVDLARPDKFGLLSFGGWSLWFYLAMAALALIAVEWWLYQRRIVG